MHSLGVQNGLRCAKNVVLTSLSEQQINANARFMPKGAKKARDKMTEQEILVEGVDLNVTEQINKFDKYVV